MVSVSLCSVTLSSRSLFSKRKAIWLAIVWNRATVLSEKRPASRSWASNTPMTFGPNFKGTANSDWVWGSKGLDIKLRSWLTSATSAGWPSWMALVISAG